MRNAEIWIAVFCLGALALNWPVLEIFDGGVYPYLLAFWLLFVVLIAHAARRSPPS